MTRLERVSKNPELLKREEERKKAREELRPRFMIDAQDPDADRVLADMIDSLQKAEIHLSPDELSHIENLTIERSLMVGREKYTQSFFRALIRNVADFKILNKRLPAISDLPFSTDRDESVLSGAFRHRICTKEFPELRDKLLFSLARPRKINK